MSSSRELFEIAEQLKAASLLGSDPEIQGPLDALYNSAEQVGASFSGSWLGYHSRVYYSRFQRAPAGAHFSQEWGLEDLSLTRLGSKGEWIEHQFDDVKEYIKNKAGNPDLSRSIKESRLVGNVFSKMKSEIVSIIETETSDRFLENLKEEIQNLNLLEKGDVINGLSPRGQIMTRDTTALSQGLAVPPHIDIQSHIISIRHSFSACEQAAEIARKAASHLERKSRRTSVEERIGTNVFIGHGRSGLWREFKDFVADRLRLPWDEFNRVPVAGVTNIARLAQMLDASAIAFLVMTAEDEMADGAINARMNVVHEAGLFQGRLGFSRAIILLEDGCSEFSNIQGLGQIRFPKGNISACFEDVRRVLEREGLIRESQ